MMSFAVEFSSSGEKQTPCHVTNCFQNGMLLFWDEKKPRCVAWRSGALRRKPAALGDSVLKIGLFEFCAQSLGLVKHLEEEIIQVHLLHIFNIEVAGI